jgi:hypothetical protein
MKTKVNVINPKQDMQDFLQAKGTGLRPPPLVEYEGYGSSPQPQHKVSSTYFYWSNYTASIEVGDTIGDRMATLKSCNTISNSISNFKDLNNFRCL